MSSIPDQLALRSNCLVAKRESYIPFAAAVEGFMAIGGQTTDRFNARQACLYTGLQFEELAEKIEVITGGCVTKEARDHLNELANVLKEAAAEFKNGMHMGDMLRCEHDELIDADFDTAWVSIGAVLSESRHGLLAIAHGTYTNLAKFPNGKAERDENGKIKKPPGWKRPDFKPYLDESVK